MAVPDERTRFLAERLALKATFEALYSQGDFKAVAEGIYNLADELAETMEQSKGREEGAVETATHIAYEILDIVMLSKYGKPFWELLDMDDPRDRFE